MEIDKSQIGLVEKFEQGIATILIDKQGGCSSCGMSGFCGSNDKCTQHIIPTDMELEVGDKVIVYIDPAKRIYSALLLFIFPIVNLALFYFIASLYFSEGYAILSAFIGLLVAFLVNRVIDKKLGNKVNYIIAGKYEEEANE